MFSFHSDPVVGDKFPCRGQAGGASRFLPLVDAVSASLFEAGEFRLRPMRAVFRGLGHGLQIAKGRGAGKFRVV
jgi:hypothetical protein